MPSELADTYIRPSSARIVIAYPPEARRVIEGSQNPRRTGSVSGALPTSKTSSSPSLRYRAVITEKRGDGNP